MRGEGEKDRKRGWRGWKKSIGGMVQMGGMVEEGGVGRRCRREKWWRRDAQAGVAGGEDDGRWKKSIQTDGVGRERCKQVVQRGRVMWKKSVKVGVTI